FDEVILYLNESIDATEDIAKSFENVNIIHGEFIGFGPTKNKAASFSKHDWILSLDSDEMMNAKLIEEIAHADFSNEANVFVLKRDNYFLGANTRSKDYIVRIYNKKHTALNDNMVHEKVMLHENTQKIALKTSFKHLNITDINQTMSKMMKYTSLAAEGKKTCFFPIVIGKALFAFFKSYILKLHILDGWRGYVIAKTEANSRFYRYLKQYINCKER
ncbi:MAG: glycosyltransferase, partial [Sulfurovum sp.]|nr:glycosyltransferase [Sulfurovum sp.]